MLPTRLCLLAVPMVLSAGCALTANHETGGVVIRQTGDTVSVTLNGDPFTEYHYKEVSRPFLYPVIGPEGARMTRDWPMSEGPNDEKDHPHHKSLWYAHGDINGVDFWSESDRAGITRQMAFLKLESGPDRGTIKTLNELVSKEGERIATDERTMVFHADGDNRFIDFTLTLHASEGDLVLGDTKEGSMAIRLNPTLRLSGKVGQGHIVTSEGVRDNDTWGKRAAWVDYHGPVNGNTVGVAIFDAPDNPRHPTWWHVRNYGLFAANPFGVHYFEKKPEGSGNLNVPAGESITWRYRFVFHKGTETEAGIADLYRQFASGD